MTFSASTRSRSQRCGTAVRSTWLARCGKRTPKWSVSRKPASRVSAGVKKASPGSAAFADDPAEFRLAVHALARQLSATPELINYKHRRDALRHWCIGPAAWQGIISQLPPTKGPFQPELSDCKRQFASEAIWARITQGEHLLAPRIIEGQLSAGDPTWHRRRDNMWHFYLVTPAKPHYAALRKILNAHADDLAAIIDRQPHPAPLPARAAALAGPGLQCG